MIVIGQRTPWRIHVCYIGIMSKLSGPEADAGRAAYSG